MSSFPAGKYARYKRATAFFLDWLLRARGRGRHAAQRVQLEAFNEVVREIAADPSCLTPKLLQELPKALAACRYAIILREHVAAFFPEDDEGQVGHQYFLELLQSWHRTLKTVEVEKEDPAAVELDNAKFENYYEVLQVDEDFFPDEGAFVAEPEAPKSAKVDRERLFQEAFADELRMELVYLFMELDELLEAVYNVYCEVKQEKRTMVEATVVVKLALDTASALTAKLQLKYPTLRSAKDMFNIVRNISQKSFRQRILQLHQSIMDELRVAYDSKMDKPAKYVSGTFLIELLGVGMTLDSFVASIPADSSTGNGIFFPSGVFGETYGEDRTPLYVQIPDTNNDKVFLMQQLPMLFNAMMDRKNAGKSGIKLAPMEPFMLLMDKFFTTREVTIPVCFACICWMKSVAALQGRGGLGRNISLTYKHLTELMKSMDAAVESNKALLANNKANNLLRRCASEIKQSTALRHVGRANPLSAGFQMLNHHFQYLHIANEVIFSTPLLRAFGHLYNALVQEGYLENIPFFDEVLKVYGQEIFTPSRAAATHGGYYRTYLLSSNLRASAVDAVCRGETFPVGSEAYKKRKAFHLSDVSKIFRLMRLNDKSVLSGGSWGDRLEAISDVCSEELFDTRVLSRDLLKLNEDLMDTFPDLIKVVGRQDDFKETVAHSVAGESRQQRVNRALEESVMKLLMPLLDAMMPDGSLDTSAIPGATVTLDTLFATEMCRGVAAVIKARFASPTQICEQKYFTLPSQPNFATQEYGRLEEGRRENYEEVFEELMELLRKSKGPLTGSDLEHFKYELKRDPDLMGLLSEKPEPGVDPMYGDLCSLLHQAAAGPAHDADLVDWMIQMGALVIQPTLHCRKAPLQKDLKIPRGLYPNTMALHNATIAGYEDIVRVILEGDNMVDINTPTFHTKETLAHLAVKNGHWGLFCIIQAFGADLRIKDGKGRALSEVTSNKEWARKLAAGTAQYYAFDAMNAGKLNARNSAQDPATAQLLQQFLAAQQAGQHDETMSAAREDLSMSATEGKKNKKKGKKNKKSVEEKSIIAAAVQQGTTVVESARVLLRLLDAAGSEVNEDQESESLSVLEDRLRKLSIAMFTRLRDPDIPASKKARDTHDACRLVKELRSLVSTFSEPSKLNSARHHIRLVIAAEAVHGIHLMQKLYRAQHAALTVVELAPVRQLCETTQKFTEFVVGTARLCVSVDRAPQAREILDVLEKRFLKTPFDKRVPTEFRELVQLYSTAREEMGLGQTSSAKTLRSLEWYLTSAVDNYNVQLTLDGLAGRPVYFEIKPAASLSDKELLMLIVGINIITELKVVACLGGQDKRIIYGGTSKADLARVRAMVLRIAERLELPLDASTIHSCSPSVHVGGFELSSAGILRAAPAS